MIKQIKNINLKMGERHEIRVQNARNFGRIMDEQGLVGLGLMGSAGTKELINSGIDNSIGYFKYRSLFLSFTNKYDFIFRYSVSLLSFFVLIILKRLLKKSWEQSFGMRTSLMMPKDIIQDVFTSMVDWAGATYIYYLIFFR